MLASLALTGCVRTVHVQPSLAIQEVHQRLAARAAAPAAQRGPCEGQPDGLRADVSFVYATPRLDDVGRRTLADTRVWLDCHPAALVAVAVKVEPHYRNPALEADLTTGRGQAVAEYLAAAGVADGRIVHVSQADDVLTVPTARLWIVANGNGF